MTVERFTLSLRGKATPEDDMGEVMLVDGMGLITEGTYAGAVRFQGRVETESESSFRETGELDLAAGKVFFESDGSGTLVPSPVDGLQLGRVCWRITGGTGAFDAAMGQLLSNFTVSEEAVVEDSIAAIIFLP
ncbi:MAG: hypothetical protein ACJAXQ_000600 [Parvibaculaceae bacterium]|jgi:hypothetical protein|tara:strand:+ start:687 stop:1085 length:399 start_codon:yes stop_codon:yes gene_type:complete